MEVKNLKKLANYLNTVDSKKFDTAYYREHDDHKISISQGVGYAVKYAMALDAYNVIDKWLYNNGNIKFMEWSMYFLCLNYDQWDWLFYYRWKYVDNTKEGVICRINYLIENGLPEDWEDQMFGNSELCYK